MTVRIASIQFVLLAFLVISPPIVIFMNPVLAMTRGSTIDTSNDHATVSSLPHISTVTETSPSASVGSPTIQAPLQIPRTLQSTDLVNSLAFYEVTFITSTTGAIDKIRMDFPAGTNIAAAGVIEKVGIGGGTLLKSGSSITYDVTTPVSIPAGTFIRLEIFGIKNPFNPSTTFTATITTRDSAGNLIDGPSQTNVYTIKQIGSNDVAESFMKRVTLLDNAAGNARGWNPGGGLTSFSIQEPSISSDIDSSFFTVEVFDPEPIVGGAAPCRVLSHDADAKTFRVFCDIAPLDGDELHYVVGNLPKHVDRR